MDGEYYDQEDAWEHGIKSNSKLIDEIKNMLSEGYTLFILGAGDLFEFS